MNTFVESDRLLNELLVHDTIKCQNWTNLNCQIRDQVHMKIDIGKNK